MTRLTTALTALLVFCIPLEYAVVLPGVGTLSRLVGTLAIGIGLATVCLRGKLRRPRPLHLAMGFFVLWALASLLWSLDVGASLHRLGVYLQLLVLVWLIWEFAPRPEQQLHLMQAYLIGIMAATASLVLDFLAGRVYGGPWEARYTGAGQNPNDLALMVALGLPMAWHLALAPAATHRVRRCVFLLYCPAAVAVILLTGCRGALIAAGVGCLLIPWTLVEMRGRHRVAVVVLGVAAVQGIALIVTRECFTRFAGMDREIVRGSWTYRRQILRSGLDVYSRYPILGIGCGAFTTVVPVLQRAGPPLPSGSQASHNTYLSMLVEEGVVGLLSLALILALGARLAWSMPPRERKLWLVLLGAWMVGVCSLTWEYRKPTWFLLALLAAQAAALTPGRSRAPGSAAESPAEPVHHA